MTAWREIFSRDFVLSIDNSGGYEKFSFSVNPSAGVFRLKMHPFFHPDTDGEQYGLEIFSEYSAHPSILDIQREMIQPVFNQWFHAIQSPSVSLLVFDASDRFVGRWTRQSISGQPLDLPSYETGWGNWTAWIRVSPFWPGELKLSITLEMMDVPATIGFPGARYNLEEDAQSRMPSTESSLRWFIGELHDHPSHGGEETLIPFIQHYETLGYQFLAMSQHDTPPLKFLPGKPSWIPIRAQELETPYGHAMLLGSREMIRWFDENGIRELSFIIQETHRQGGLFCVLHPFAAVAGSLEPSWRLREMDWNAVDLLEVWSGVWRERFPEMLKALDFWDRLLNRGLHIYGVCGKGGHTARDEGLLETLPKCLILSEDESETGLLSALKQGHCYMTVEPAVALWAESEYGGAFMGDELRVPVGDAYLLRITVSQMERCFLRLKTRDGVLCEMPVASTRETDLKFVMRSETKIQWFRLEIYRYGRPLDDLIALTNPLFVRGMISG